MLFGYAAGPPFHTSSRRVENKSGAMTGTGETSGANSRVRLRLLDGPDKELGVCAIRGMSRLFASGEACARRLTSIEGKASMRRILEPCPAEFARRAFPQSATAYA
ncbi:MAG: hypothetical protein AMXMBFR4_19610 [Candidatus Hydrogenedentota bacterium]